MKNWVLNTLAVFGTQIPQPSPVGQVGQRHQARYHEQRQPYREPDSPLVLLL
jgi:hypothetical protein